MWPILECASVPHLHGFDHDIQLRGEEGGGRLEILLIPFTALN